MKYVPVIARILLGFVFAASAIYSFATGFATPPDLPENLRTFTNGLMASTYFMPFLKGVELVCGLLLLSGFYVPLALVVLAPIVINIILVHIFLAPEGIVVALVIGALEVYLAFFAKPYKDTVCQLFRK